MAPTFMETILQMVQFGMGAGQIYLPKQPQFTLEDLKETYHFTDHYQYALFFHAPINLNPSGGKEVALQGTPEAAKQQRYLGYLRKELVAQLDLCSQASPDGGVVLHIGFCEDREYGLKRVATTLKLALKMKDQCMTHTKRPRNLLLENAAGQGTALGVELWELELLAREVPEINFCIDTCHLFAAGEYDISHPEIMEQYFLDFDERIGLGRLKLIHLNDSKKGFGCRVDRHEEIGNGMIWGKSVDSLLVLLEICLKHSIPVILETPNIANDFDYLDELIQKLSSEKDI